MRMRSMRFFLGALAAGLVPAAMQGPAAAQEAPRIETVHWPWIASYCTFTRADHELDYNDLETWRFVFFTEFGAEGEYERAFMRIDGQLRELVLQTVTVSDVVELSIYQSWDEPPYVVNVEARKTGGGYEAVDYAGRITVSRNGLTSVENFKGDCGV